MDGDPRTDTLAITPEILKLIAEIVEHAACELGVAVHEVAQALR
jgi:hypothetical protein